MTARFFQVADMTHMQKVEHPMGEGDPGSLGVQARGDGAEIGAPFDFIHRRRRAR